MSSVNAINYTVQIWEKYFLYHFYKYTENISNGRSANIDGFLIDSFGLGRIF